MKTIKELEQDYTEAKKSYLSTTLKNPQNMTRRDFEKREKAFKRLEKAQKEYEDAKKDRAT
jgi:hypothetical protein